MELDDDELLELACASMEPEQEVAGPDFNSTKPKELPSARKAGQVFEAGKGMCSV